MVCVCVRVCEMLTRDQLEWNSVSTQSADESPNLHSRSSGDRARITQDASVREVFLDSGASETWNAFLGQSLVLIRSDDSPAPRNVVIKTLSAIELIECGARRSYALRRKIKTKLISSFYIAVIIFDKNSQPRNSEKKKRIIRSEENRLKNKKLIEKFKRWKIDIIFHR